MFWLGLLLWYNLPQGSFLLTKLFLQKPDKVQLFYWSSQTALGSGGCSFVTMLKNLKTDLFQTFSTWPQILSALLHHTSTPFYWPSTTKYEPVPPYTDLVPSCINHYRLLLIQYQQVPTSTNTFGIYPKWIWPCQKYPRIRMIEKSCRTILLNISFVKCWFHHYIYYWHISFILRPKGGEKGSHQTSIGDIARGDDFDEDDGDNDVDGDDGSRSVAMVKL